MEPSLAGVHHVLWTTEVSGTHRGCLIQHCLHPATTWLLICFNNCLPSSFSSLPYSVRTMIQLTISWFPFPVNVTYKTICVDCSNGFLKSWLVALQDAWPLDYCWLCKCQPCFHHSPRRCYCPMTISKVSWVQVPMEPTSYLTHFLFRRFISSYCIDGDKSQRFRSKKQFPVFKTVDATLLVACPWSRGIHFDSSWWECFANHRVVYHLVEIQQ